MKKCTALVLAACLFLTVGCAPMAADPTASPSGSESTALGAELYVPMTLAKARDAEAGTTVQVEGVVVQIAYGPDNTPVGVFLADNTNSIFVSDPALAQQLQIGNRISIQATKNFSIPASEILHAQQFGYKGCCQLEQAVLLSNDGRTDNAYDHSWIPQISIRELLEIPVSENITTSLYKVHTYIQADAEGSYYFWDLDGVTGSSVYTQCAGADLQWLSAYEGKLCELYLAVYGVQTTEDGCIYHFQPVQMLQADYHFPASQVPEHIVKYYALEQFRNSYSHDPALALMTSVSSSLLDFQDARLAYHSSDDTVLDLRQEGDKLYLHTVQPGTATITIIAYYDAYAYSQTIEITVTQAPT